MAFLKTVFNFTYRLSGNMKIAQILTEKVMSEGSGEHNDDLIFLKQAWESFLKYYGHFDFQSEDLMQRALLSLSPELRCAIILRDIFGYSYNKIALVSNSHEAEVAQLIKLGRQEITKSVNGQNITVRKI